MRSLQITLLIVLLALAGLCGPAWAEVATMDEALNVANNWISTIIEHEGSWGGSETAAVDQIQEFKRGDRVLGFCCRVEPSGFVVVSLLKGLAPVKAHSPTSYLDPASDAGPADLLKLKMEFLLDTVENLLGPVAEVQTEDLERIVDIDYRPAWEALQIDCDEFRRALASDDGRNVYEEGEVLLTSNWHQGDPYSRLCPLGFNGCTDAHCRVGCVATAGAQVMRHWRWPPEYDWPNMPDEVLPSSPPAEIDAVALLCVNIGILAGMNYCADPNKPCASSTPTAVMEGVYEDNHYGTECVVVLREDYTWEEWWAGPGMIKDNINVNRPIQYRIKGHSIVCDGWREWFWGYFLPEYHMNYGWANDFTTWYVLDALYQVGGGTYLDEYMVLSIVPDVAISSPVAGTFPRNGAFPYRYFDRDCNGGPATFQAGQLVQFLHTVRLAPHVGDVRFEGASGLHTRLFTRGDDTKGVLIQSGVLKVGPGGVIRLP
jgi:hypothetical protein